MKNSLLHRQAGLSLKKGQSILEIVIYMVILGVIAVAGSIGYSVYLQDANGSACTQQLSTLDVADKAYCATYNVTSTASYPSYSAPTASFTAFLDGKAVNVAGGLQCPAGGTYAAPAAAENANTITPGFPTCSLASQSQFSGTRFHSLTVN
jgi:Tfp pilus assembly protein PilE